MRAIHKMYLCKKCGNEKEFIEYSLFQTRLTIENGEIDSYKDKFIECMFVICDECEASSEDGEVVLLAEII